MDMFTIRSLGGMSLLLFGTTFLWMTPAFASKGVATDGVLWAITRVLVLAALAGFCLATLGLFTRSGWWETTAIISAAVGVVGVVLYWAAQWHVGGDPGAPINILVHVLGLLGVFALLLIPVLERWVDFHVMGR